MKVRDIMNINAIRIRAGTPMRQAAEILAATNASDLAVVDDANRFLGVVSEGDIMRAVLPKMTEVIEAGGTLQDTYDMFQEKGRSLAGEAVDAVMIRNAYVLAPTDHVHKAATMMARDIIRRLPVVEDGLLVGTVSRADVCRAALG